MSLHKQIDLVMSTVVKSTDKIYEGDRKSETADPNISYIRVVRMFATTADFKDMMKQLKKGGVSKENSKFCCVAYSFYFIVFTCIRLSI